jgi:chromosome segregation ATPase
MSAEDWKTLREALAHVRWRGTAKEHSERTAALARLEAEAQQWEAQANEACGLAFDHGREMEDRRWRAAQAERARREQAEAQAAAMRECLTLMRSHLAHQDQDANHEWMAKKMGEAIASTDAGKALPERVRNAEASKPPVHIGEALGLLKTRAEQAEAERDALHAQRDDLRVELNRAALELKEARAEVERLREALEGIAQRYANWGVGQDARAALGLGDS